MPQVRKYTFGRALTPFVQKIWPSESSGSLGSVKQYDIDANKLSIHNSSVKGQEFHQIAKSYISKLIFKEHFFFPALP